MNTVISISVGDTNELPKRVGKGASIVDFPSDYIVIDTETTGLDTDFCHIIEVAALKIKNFKLVDSFSSLIGPYPFGGLDDFITELTGITDEMLYSAPTSDTVFPSLRDFIGESVLVGHNVNFDVNFLYDAFESVFQSGLSNNFIDTMRISRRLFKDLKHHRLSDTAAACGVDYSDAHRAEADCNITFSCFETMRNIVNTRYSSVDNFKKTFGKNGIDCSAIKATTENFDEDHPFYKKTVVFTGALRSATRAEAMQSVVNVGGVVANHVTGSTNFLVVGSFEYIRSVKEGKSSKIKKAEAMQLDGKDITVMSESTFYSLLQNL